MNSTAIHGRQTTQEESLVKGKIEKPDVILTRTDLTNDTAVVSRTR